MYARRTGDPAVMEQTVASLRAHLQFMLPDGAWDNSWGTRNFKWTWWGSRTSDGCHTAYRVLADKDPRFAEVSARNLALMAACTHDGLLYGGPDYRAAGYKPCIHHTFSHAAALAAVLDLARPTPVARTELPRDKPYGLKSFPEIGTHLAAIGPWRATFTDYDFDYLAPAGGGHASGGAVSLLYHQALGPVLAASMTRYKAVEISNQQAPIDVANHQVLTPRIELVEGKEVFTNIADLTATFEVSGGADAVRTTASGKLVTPEGKGTAAYALTHALTPAGLTLTARVTGLPAGQTARLVLPVIARADQAVERHNDRTVTVAKPGGRITLIADADFAPVPAQRVFNLVPGLQAAPLAIALTESQTVTVRITA